MTGEEKFGLFMGPIGLTWVYFAPRIASAQQKYGAAPGFMRRRMSPSLGRVAGVGLAVMGVAMMVPPIRTLV